MSKRPPTATNLSAILYVFFRCFNVTQQKEFADIVGVSQSTISKVMRSERLSLKLYHKIRRVAGTSVPPELLEQLGCCVLNDNETRW